MNETLWQRIIQFSALLLSICASVLVLTIAVSAFLVHTNQTKWLVITSPQEMIDTSRLPSNVTVRPVSDSFSSAILKLPVASSVLAREHTRFFLAHVTSGNRNQLPKEYSQKEATPILERTLLYEHLSKTSLLIPAGALLGLACGLLFPFLQRFAAPILLASAGFMLVKLLSGCPTCGSVTLLGFRSEILAALIFSLLFLLTTLTRGKSTLAGFLTPIFLTMMLAVQLIWTITQDQVSCLPCACAAFFSSLLLASLATKAATTLEKWSDSQEFWLRRSAWFASIAIPSLVFVLMPNALAQMPDAASLASDQFQPTWSHIHRLKDLGVKASGIPAVIYVGRYGCHPCQSGLQAIDQNHMTGFSYFYVGEQPPDNLRRWTRIKNSSQVPATPSVLFVGKDGVIQKAEMGFMTDAASLTLMNEKIAIPLHLPDQKLVQGKTHGT